MNDSGPLSDSARRQLANQLADEQIKEAPRVDQPVAILSAGQPGAGKSFISERLGKVLGAKAAPPVIVNPDEVRPEIPYVKSAITAGATELPGPAYHDSGTIAAMMVERAAEAQRNIIYDGTLSNHYYADKTATLLRDNGYRIEVHAMAVDPDLSHARTYTRREIEIEDRGGGYGRGVEDEFHNNAVNGLVDTVAKLQDAGKVDSITLYDRSRNEIGTFERRGDTWEPNAKAAELISGVHKASDDLSRAEAAATWIEATDKIKARDGEDLAKVRSFRDAALAREAGEMPLSAARSDPNAPTRPLTPEKALAELQKILPKAAEQAERTLTHLQQSGARAHELAAARYDVTLTTHERGPVYQAQLLKQAHGPSVSATITAQQTHLERFREIAAGVADQVKGMSAPVREAAMRTLDTRQKQPDLTVTVKPADKTLDRTR